MADLKPCGSGLAREGGRPASENFMSSIKQGILGRFYGLFFCLEKAVSHRTTMHNQMNKYDLWIYKSAVKVTPSTRDRKPRIANTLKGIV
ncbi:hypothetical protein [Pseudomonas sp. GM79]|uniref:hypothetical protein n=1 Tax=Pseudomonas sp. GM79 TaxID=1144338 RepID=UPI0012F76C49|nr:hypothetical protein [Pseudomonas sp. GM79]